MSISIKEIKLKYRDKLDPLDMDILIAHTIGKPREFVLAHPEYVLKPSYKLLVTSYVRRRINNEPIAYIIGKKEFYGLDFEVNEHTLIPRPETEMLVDIALEEMLHTPCSMLHVIDIGTGSGNIIISIAKQLKLQNYELGIRNYELYGTDISKEALKIAKKNSVAKKIKFLHGNLLSPLSKKLMKLKVYPVANASGLGKLIILANLPYLSKEIYQNSPKDVKNYEPKSALYSDNLGLSHYEDLLKQIKALKAKEARKLIAILEISPEQKQLLNKIINQYFPKAKIKFYKDLAGKWRVCKISLC
jgi:release factor glutamine methyltransferase